MGAIIRGSSSSTFSDADFSVTGSSDATKIQMLEVDGLTSTLTSTLTIGGYSVTGTTFNVFAAITPGRRMSGTGITAGTVVRKVVTSLTGPAADTLEMSLPATANGAQSITYSTGISTGTTRSVTSLDANYLPAGTNIENVFTKPQVVASDSDATHLTLRADTAQSVDMLQVIDAAGSKSHYVDRDGSPHYLGTIYLDSTGFINTLTQASLSANRTQTLQNKTGTIALHASTLSGLAMCTGDAAVASGGAATSGNLGKVDLALQTAASLTGTLTSTPPSGLYLINVIVMCTTAGTLGDIVDVAVTATDNVGAQTVHTAVSVTAAGRNNNTFVLRRSSGNITYTATRTSGTYAVYIRVSHLG